VHSEVMAYMASWPALCVMHSLTHPTCICTAWLTTSKLVWTALKAIIRC